MNALSQLALVFYTDITRLWKECTYATVDTVDIPVDLQTFLSLKYRPRFIFDILWIFMTLWQWLRCFLLPSHIVGVQCWLPPRMTANQAGIYQNNRGQEDKLMRVTPTVNRK